MGSAGSSFHSILSQQYWRAVPQARCQDLTPNTHVPLQTFNSESQSSWPAHTHTHTHRLTALFLGLPRWAGTRKVNQTGFYWSKRQWVAVASAGPYASLHPAPDRQPRQHLTTQFLQARCPSCHPANSTLTGNDRSTGVKWRLSQFTFIGDVRHHNGG